MSLSRRVARLEERAGHGEPIVALLTGGEDAANARGLGEATALAVERGAIVHVIVLPKGPPGPPSAAYDGKDWPDGEPAPMVRPPREGEPAEGQAWTRPAHRGWDR